MYTVSIPGDSTGVAVFRICAISVSVAVFPSPSGSEEEYPHCVIRMTNIFKYKNYFQWWPVTCVGFNLFWGY
jgi:hypothetical protein